MTITTEASERQAMVEVLRFKLTHALTQYDRKQSTKRGHNPYALGIYFEMVEQVCADVERGAQVREAVLRGFNDRVLSVCLKALGEADFTVEEKERGGMVYKPVTAENENS